ncbi:NAD(P)-dependent oxidoreductase [Sphingomonas sp. ID0503]|uniref:precorrin-2 dehydrogenase/sirohydrochlorin ferrochelatase family protein n=1 Tax=Sphingomonas sp. ID0503 TaxID=3399691 RepID=UPI003AFA9628
MDALPIFVNLRRRNVILIGDSEAADAKRRLIERAGGVAVGEDAQAALAVVALDAPEEAAARLQSRGLLVNVPDRPELCDFTMPAIIDRAPVLIAVSTAGRSAGLAKALRQRIEAMLPARLGALADALYAARAAIRGRWPDTADRRRAIDAALSEGGALDPLAEDAAERVGAWTEGEAAPTGLVRIRLSSPDPDDLTLRTARLLGQADRVYHRAEVPDAILVRARADAARIPCDAPPADLPPGLHIDLDFAP